MIEINLIPDVKQELLHAQRQRSLVISASIVTSIVAVGLVVLMVVYIFGVQGVRSAYLDGQIKTKNEELAKVEDLSKILTIQNQLAKIPELNDKKLMSSRVFDVVSAITPTGDTSVSFSQINVVPTVVDANAAPTDGAPLNTSNAGGKIILEGQAASYEVMESFKKRIDNTSFQYVDNGEEMLVKLASNINNSDISYGEDSTGKKVVRFMISFDYAPELFSAKTAKQELAYKLTVNGNVTDSFTGIPRFTQRASDLEGGQ